jgi:hypothetical protein
VGRRLSAKHECESRKPTARGAIGSSFYFDFKPKLPHPVFAITVKARRCCLTFAFVVRLHGLRRDYCLFRHAPVSRKEPERFYKGASDPKEVTETSPGAYYLRGCIPLVASGA